MISSKTIWRYTALLILAYAAALGVSGLLRHLGEPDQYPLFSQRHLPSRATFRVDPGRNPYGALFSSRAVYIGDFRPIYDAAAGKRRDPDYRMYRPDELKERRAAFVYTPFAAWLVSPLVARDYTPEEAADALHRFNRILWLGMGTMAFRLLARGRRVTVALAAAFTVQYLAYFPIAKALQLTQASVWIAFFLVAAAWLLQRRLPVAAGLALALGASIKPHLAAVALLLALQSGATRRTGLAALAALSFTGLLSIAYAGIPSSLDYVFHALPMLSGGYAYHPNQSVNGLLMRLFTSEDPAVFNLSMPVSWIKFTSTVFGLCVLALAAVTCRSAIRRRREPELLCYALAVTAVTIASPICWTHHMTAFIAPLAIVARRILDEPRLRSPALLATAFASAILTGAFYDARHLSGLPLGLLTGFEFYGALLLLGTLVAFSRHDNLTSEPRDRIAGAHSS